MKEFVIISIVIGLLIVVAAYVSSLSVVFSHNRGEKKKYKSDENYNMKLKKRPKLWVGLK